MRLFIVLASYVVALFFIAFLYTSNTLPLLFYLGTLLVILYIVTLIIK
ncbi:hypothetical protein [Priestia abyssalis]|nr:hypothetical protein [Priestia abyssalis]